MSYHGDYRAADTVDFFFSTVSTSGVPTTLSGSPVVSVYKSNNTTESTSGVTLTVDFDGRTGCNQVHITTSSDGTFYADGSDFSVVITTGTVGGVSVVGIVVGSFSISNRSALRPTTVGRTLDVAATGEAGLDFDNIHDASGSHTLTNIRVPNVTLTDTLTTYTGNTPQTGDSFARIGSAGAGLTALGDTRIAHLDADISSRTKPADTQAAVTTVTNLTNAPTSGDFTAAMKTSLNAATPAVTVSDKTGFSLSSAGIQAIWDRLTSALTTVGSIGKLLVDNIDAAISSRSMYAGGDTSGTTTLLSRLTSTRAGNLDNLDAAVSTRLATGSYTAPDNADILLIKSKTDNLPASPAATGDAMTLTGTYDAAKTAAQAGDAMTLTSAYDPAKTAAQAGDSMALTSGERSTLAGVIWANASRTLTDFGTLVADAAAAVWAAGARTLTAFGFTVATDVSSTVTTNLDAKVSDTLASADYTAPPTAIENADETLGRDWALVSVVADHSLLNVLRGLGTRNKVLYNSGTGKFDIYNEAGDTVIYHITPTTDGAALPIISVTPS